MHSTQEKIPNESKGDAAFGTVLKLVSVFKEATET
jgi:hypothetical protein